METTQSPHQPVLLEQTVRLLKPVRGERYLDLTAGYGGHADAIMSQTQAPEQAVLVDRDIAAVRFLRNRFSEHSPHILHSDMVKALETLKQDKKQFDLILLDIGVSSLQLDSPERGFSLKREGPLDMRMDQNQELTAEIIVNNWSEEQLRQLLKDYGEERQAGRIARAIVHNRPLSTTTQLADVVSQSVHIRGSPKIHPATRTFQAIRIAVNAELDQLETALSLTLELLADNGRIGVISFHSLEDRIVKRMFAARAGGRLDSDLQLLTKRPVTAAKDDPNPRARSAKLRAAVKTKKHIGKE